MTKQEVTYIPNFARLTVKKMCKKGHFTCFIAQKVKGFVVSRIVSSKVGEYRVEASDS